MALASFTERESRMTISASVIEAMLAAGATCDLFAVLARQHFPDLAPTVDALIEAGSDTKIIAAMLRASAADAGAAAREAERRKRNTDGKRAKRQAAKVAVADSQSELPLSSMSADIEDSADPSSSSPPHPPNNYSQDDDEEGARVVSLISAEAHRLASEIAAIAGIDPDPKAWPPEWHGAPWLVQSWLTAGWPAEAIRIGARTTMARKREGPPDRPRYFEPEIRNSVAQMRRQPPTIAITSQEGNRYGRIEAPETGYRPADRSAAQIALQRAADRRARAASGGGD